jgi:hypothetical protein
MELIHLASQWMELKTQERLIAEHRIAIEEKIKGYIPLPVEGQKSMRAGDFKITAINKLYYKLDKELFETVKLIVPPEFRLFKEVLDETAMKKALKDSFVADSLSAVLEVKPAKTSFEIVKVSL